MVRQYKPAAILGWRGLRVTVIKLTFRHPGRPGDCQINNNNNNNNNNLALRYPPLPIRLLRLTAKRGHETFQDNKTCTGLRVCTRSEPMSSTHGNLCMFLAGRRDPHPR